MDRSVALVKAISKNSFPSLNEFFYKNIHFIHESNLILLVDWRNLNIPFYLFGQENVGKATFKFLDLE